MENLVSIIMGSSSDWPIMKEAADILEKFGIKYEVEVISAHRAPDILFEYAKKLDSRGIKVVIAGAGGAAHLPGVTAALTVLPVIGVPIKSSLSIEGLDSILSILQMPPGVPVATVSVNGAKNAGILAAQIISLTDNKVKEKLYNYKKELTDEVLKKSKELKEQIKQK